MNWRYIVFLLLIVSYFAHGQNTDVTVDEGIEKLKGMKKLKKYTDLKQVLKERPLINGGLNLTSRFNDVYSVSGASSLQPFIYTVGGNLNVKMFDFSVPFSFSYSNQKFGYDYKNPFQNPFNRISITPQYKWIKLYLGTGSISFTPYTLQGIPFRGYGVELTPQKWNFSALYGQFQSPVPSTDPQVASIPERMGWGIKLGHNGARHVYSVQLFNAYDVTNSVSPYIVGGDGEAKRLDVTPHFLTNYVGSLALRTRLHKRVTLDGEFALSAMKQTIPDEYKDLKVKVDSSKQGVNDYKVHDAGKFLLSLRLDRSTWGLKYERVSPNYTTLGAQSASSDKENVSLQTAYSNLLKNKMSFNAKAGVERNNLSKTKMSTSVRWVGNFQTSYIASDELSFQFSASNMMSNIQTQNKQSANTNYSATTQQVAQTIQSNRSINFSTQYMQDPEVVMYPKTFNFSLAYQRTDDSRSGNGSNENNWNDNYGISTGYTQNFTPYELDYGFNLGYNISGPVNDRSTQVNVGSNVTKITMDGDLIHNITMYYGFMLSGSTSANASFNITYNTGYNFKTQSDVDLGKLSFNAAYSQGFLHMASVTAFRQFNVNISYVYSFSNKMSSNGNSSSSGVKSREDALK